MPGRAEISPRLRVESQEEREQNQKLIKNRRDLRGKGIMNCPNKMIQVDMDVKVTAQKMDPRGSSFRRLPREVPPTPPISPKNVAKTETGTFDCSVSFPSCNVM